MNAFRKINFYKYAKGFAGSIGIASISYGCVSFAPAFEKSRGVIEKNESKQNTLNTVNTISTPSINQVVNQLSPNSTPLKYAKIISVEEGTNFNPDNHYYPKILNAELHPLVNYFLSLGINRIAERYCHLHPRIDKNALINLLKHEPSHLKWSGADLFVTTTEGGKRQLTVIETNTCPSGQKSMPRSDNELNDGYGYKQLIQSTFKPMLNKVSPELFDAKLAVIYDKNQMEASGYAHAMANTFGEDVYLVEYFNDDDDPPVRFDQDGVMSIRDESGEWIKIRAAFRYVTQNPWDRIPINTKTLILNPIIACISGGRNKNLAAKAYDIFNAKLQTKYGLESLKLNTPETIKDVPFAAIPIMIKRFGGVGVIKSPYGNAGVDVFTITNSEELDDFMEHFGEKGMGRGYGNKFIVQTLIGNSNWSSDTISGKFYHVGTVPDRKGNFYAADIRMMIYWNGFAWSPLCVYSRRALQPLSRDLDGTVSSWDILGTNLSVKIGENEWKSDTNRLMVMDTRSFNRLGIGLDDLIDGYVQSVLATISIDNLCKVFMRENAEEHGYDESERGKFDFRMFSTLNPDKAILDDIRKCNYPNMDRNGKIKK